MPIGILGFKGMEHPATTKQIVPVRQTPNRTPFTLTDLTQKELTYDGGIRQLREELAPAAADAEAEEEGLVRGLGIARSRIHVMQQ